MNRRVPPGGHGRRETRVRAVRAVVRTAAILCSLFVFSLILAHDPIAAVFVREAERFQEAAAPAAPQETTITFRLLNRANAPLVRILKNGAAVANFSQGEVRVVVRPGDRIEIDGRADPGTVLVAAAWILGGRECQQTLATTGDVRGLEWASGP
ncbi:MAG: hypothetical protein IRZ18_04255 [Clostridia bacterium]|nr:hypothetical protein [Clostridia bacterium]